ncbi:ROK family protein [Alicyclobacillus curvatus]|nr:ROK family protein [Alicyclobacillus curvatus]
MVKQEDGRVWLAIDIGGTRARVAALTSFGTIFERAEVSTRQRDPAKIVDELFEQLTSMRESWDAQALGISNVGLIGQQRGRNFSINFPGWQQKHVDNLVQALSLPFVVINDVKAAALAECRLGVTHGAEPGLYVNMGTGIAVSMTCHGHVFHGATGMSGEVGHWVPLRGALVPAQDDIIERRIGGAALDHMADLIGLTGGAQDLSRAMSSNPAAHELWKQAVFEMARVVANCVIMADPAVVALGGSVARNPDVVSAIENAVELFCLSVPNIAVSELGDDAGLIGAAIHAHDHFATTSGRTRGFHPQ